MNVHFILNNMNIISTSIKINELEQEFISVFVRLADLLNLPKSVGELYGILFISINPMCLDDLMIKLNISKGSTSQGLKILRSFGAIKKIYVPGDRKDFYVVEDSLRKITSGFANEQIRPHLDSGKDRLKKIKNILTENPDLNNSFLKEKIKRLENWEKRANQVLPIILKLVGEKK